MGKELIPTPRNETPSKYQTNLIKAILRAIVFAIIIRIVIYFLVERGEVSVETITIVTGILGLIGLIGITSYRYTRPDATFIGIQYILYEMSEKEKQIAFYSMVLLVYWFIFTLYF